MEIAIQVVWWIGLVGALAATVVILKQVVLVLRLLRDIDQLVRVTRTAARKLASHLEADVPISEQTRSVRSASSRLASAVDALNERVGSFTAENI